MAGTLRSALADEFGPAFEYLVDTLPWHTTLAPYARRSLSDISMIVLHHTQAPRSTTWRSVAAYHVSGNGWPGIGYCLGLRDYAGRCTVSMLNDPGAHSYHAHTVGNLHGLAVCVAGKFDNYKPTAAELDALRRIVAVVRRWATWQGTLPVVGHGQVPGNQTSCPGRYLKEVIPNLNATVIDDLEMRRRIWAAAKAAQVISPNPGSAIEVLMREQGFTPIGREVDVLDAAGIWEGVTQLGYQPGSNANGIAFYASNKTPSGQWEAHIVEMPA